jgi:hypothetical protein
LKYINNILFDYLDNFYITYLNNILIYSDDIFFYYNHVNKVLHYLRDINLQADIRKYKFSVTRTKYLGFIISTNSIKIDPKKTDIIYH